MKKTDALSLSIYLACASIIIFGVIDLIDGGEDWYSSNYAYWRIIGGVVIAFILWFKNRRNRKGKGL